MRIAPIENCAPLIVKFHTSSRLGSPKMAAISGVISHWTKALTTTVNAVPITMATARSITLPRRMNSLKPLSMVAPPWKTAIGDHRSSCLRGVRVRYGRRSSVAMPCPTPMHMVASA